MESNDDDGIIAVRGCNHALGNFFHHRVWPQLRFQASKVSITGVAAGSWGCEDCFHSLRCLFSLHSLPRQSLTLSYPASNKLQYELSTKSLTSSCYSYHTTASCIQCICPTRRLATNTPPRLANSIALAICSHLIGRARESVITLGVDNA